MDNQFIKLAISDQDFNDVYRLRYNAYFSVGAIKENSSLAFYDNFDKKPNSFVFQIMHGDTIIGSQRCVTSHCGGIDLLSHQTFPNELDNRFFKKGIVVEANRFVMDPAFDSANTAFQLLAFRSLVITCRLFNADFWVGCVRKNHVPFYKRAFYMELISDFKKYPGLESEMGLIYGNFPSCYEKVCRKWGDKLRVDDDELDYWRNTIKACDLYRDVVFP